MIRGHDTTNNMGKSILEKTEEKLNESEPIKEFSKVLLSGSEIQDNTKESLEVKPVDPSIEENADLPMELNQKN